MSMFRDKEDNQRECKCDGEVAEECLYTYHLRFKHGFGGAVVDANSFEDACAKSSLAPDKVDIANIHFKGYPSPIQRLKTLAVLKSRGIVNVGDNFVKLSIQRDYYEREYYRAVAAVKREVRNVEDQLRQATEAYYFEGGRSQ